VSVKDHNPALRGAIRTVMALLVIMLLAIIGFLLRQNYTAQSSLQQAILERYQHEAEKSAMGLGHFFSERRADLLDLAQAREVAIFFENKALGMSMAYGLRASLLAVRARIAQMVVGKQIQGQPVYDRIVFLQTDGSTLADSAYKRAPELSPIMGLTYLAPDNRQPTMVLGGLDAPSLQMHSLAYYFKGRYAGQILAWINCDLAYQHLESPSLASGSHEVGILCPNGLISFCMHDNRWQFAASDSLNSLPTGRFISLVDPEADAPGREYFLLRSPIDGTPLSLVSRLYKTAVFGEASLWYLPTALGVLSLIGLSGIGLIWRISTRNAALQVRLEEAACREKEVGEKNRSLRREVMHRRKIEMSLRKSEERLQLAIDGGDLGTWDWDVTTGAVAFNDRWTRMLGYRLEEIEPSVRAWKDLRHPEDAPRVKRVLEKHLSGDIDFYETEHRLRAKDGSWKWVLDKGRVIERDADGRPVRMVGTHLDIDERKQVLERLCASERKYRAIFESFQDIYYRLDDQGQILTISPSVETILGYSARKLVGRPATVIFSQTERYDALNALLMDAGRISDMECSLANRSGEVVPVSLSAHLVRDNENGHLEIEGVLRDITRRKQDEEALNRYRSQLEQMVEERTHKLQRTQKVLVNKAIEAGRVQLSAMILHNIGNALTPVGVYLGKLKRTDLMRLTGYLDKCYGELKNNGRSTSDRQQGGAAVFNYMGQVIGAVQENVRQRNDLVAKIDENFAYIADILTLQSAYAPTEQNVKERCDLNKIVADALQMQASALDKRCIQVVRQMANPLPALILDKNKMMQVIINVIKNAYESIDAVPNGGKSEGRLEIATFLDDGGIGLRIRDNGAGIAADRLDAIFQYGNSEKGSTGFGLPYCKMYVEANQGTLEITSGGPGQGATVEIRFPQNGCSTTGPSIN